MSVTPDNSHTLKTPIGKRAYFVPSNPTQLVELITQHYNTNKARSHVFRVVAAEIPRCK